jgi:phosphomethylpyrimidine synthase
MIIKRIKAGEIPSDIRMVAEKERIEVDKLLEKIVSGRVVVPKNIGRRFPAVAIGEGLRTKVNANLGTAEEYQSLEEELLKLRVAIEAGSDTVMDLSTGGDLDEIRRMILQNSSVPVGTVPIYQAAIEAKEKYNSVVMMTADDMFDAIERQARDGVDFITVHCGINQKVLAALESSERITNVVSRGGAFLLGWMLYNKKENPLYDQFDRLVDIAKEYDLTLSLGDGMRPGCLADASDGAQFQELINLGELVALSRDAEVQVIVEGPGHVPFDQIEANIRMEKSICRGAPFYVLGPLVTDVAPGYDHITCAIGATYAASCGADFICYVTPREHLGLPTADDVKDGVIAARIAAHAADVVKKVPGAKEWDIEMAKARKGLDWEKQVDLAIDPEKARQGYEERKSSDVDVCSMCGEFCALKLVSQYLESPEIGKCN